jgi:3-oxoacyl-[acyl-carrier protein] reductase
MESRLGKLTGKKCLVTGGARGIGREIALAFAREGADVGIIDLRIEQARATAAEIAALGVRALALAADVSLERQITQAVSEAERELGEIDVLVNNAGIIDTAQVAEMPTEMWDRMMAVNLRGVFLCTRAVLPGMTRRGDGRIINISSQLAHKGAPNMAHYVATKSAIIGFTRSLAREVCADGILVNAICPGAVATKLGGDIPSDLQALRLSQIPLGRFGAAEEIAPTAVLLAASDGAFYVGATMNLNGGDVMI